MQRKWLVEIRESENKSQEIVAKACHISRAYYTQIELGVRNPSPLLAKTIAEVLNFEARQIDWTIFFADNVTDSHMGAQ